MKVPTATGAWVSALMLATLCACGGSAPEPVHTIGLATNTENGQRNIRGFVEGMAALGYVEGRNVTYVSADEPTADGALEELLRSFVDASVDLVFTAGTPTGVAAHQITQDTGIPVVFGVIADPVGAGVLDDLGHPGGAITGVKLPLDQGRRLELLTQIAPEIARVLVPYNPDDTAGASAVAQIEGVADQLGVELVLVPAGTDDDVTTMLGDVPVDVDAIFLVPDSVVNARVADILGVATRMGLPTSGPSTAQVEQGVLMAYGFIHERAGAQAARLADQILRGTNPGDLPVEDTESYLGINLATAQRLGLRVPDEALQQAEIIIRPAGTGTPGS